jgi:hypothetical protein
METYANLSGRSGIRRFEIRSNGIVVEFKGRARYFYSTSRPGTSAVNEMKRLAIEGVGLNTYISKYVGDRYSRKMR